MITSKINSVNEAVLTGVASLLEKNGQVWTGTMTELNLALVKNLGRKSSSMLPGSPGALRVVLNRVINRIRNRGISVRFARTTDHARTRYVKFTR